jgi:hypothetical protein
MMLCEETIMKSSREEAISVLRRWKEKPALIQSVLETPVGITCSLWAYVTEISGSIVRLKGRSAEVTFDLAQVGDDGFQYGEPSEFTKDSEVRLDPESKWRSLLAIRFPGSTRLLLGIFR